jgi:hypothetical protein
MSKRIKGKVSIEHWDIENTKWNQISEKLKIAKLVYNLNSWSA